MFKITLSNTGGELDSRNVASEEGIKAALLKMIEECASFSPGDTITITEIE